MNYLLCVYAFFLFGTHPLVQKKAVWTFYKTIPFLWHGKKEIHTGLEQNEGEQITEFKCLDELSLEPAWFTSEREREKESERVALHYGIAFNHFRNEPNN